MVSNSSSATPEGSKSAPGAPRSLNDVVIRLAGNSQDGIQAVGGFLARLAGRSAQEVMTYMTIPSTISGGPSIFQVRMGTGDILSAGDRADVLVAFYQHSYEHHRASLRPGGVLLYDSDHVQPNPDDHDVTAVGVPFTSATVEAVGGSAKEKGKNIYVLGLLARMFDLNVAKLTQLIKERFGGKNEDIVRNALLAFDAGYAYPAENLQQCLYRLEEPAPAPGARPQVTTDGNSAISYGLIAAGVRYGAAYPITPWSSIMETLRTELPKYGGIFVQCEDEIAAISTALGFSYSGNLAITGSSGPGLSLKAEALGWAVMAEIPLIVVNIQRGGPSTGLPTNIEQSDLMQAIYGSHGDAPRVVLAPATVEDCFYISLEAARIAREFSTPVIILSDQALATRIHFNTFGGNPVVCSQGKAVLEVIDREGLQANSLAVGNHLQAGFRRLADKHTIIGDVRGKGLMLGVELVKDRTAKAPAKEETLQVFESAKDLGLLIGKGGFYGNVLRIKPPMCFTKADADFALEVIDHCLTRL